jgi:hypothetical protein
MEPGPRTGGLGHQPTFLVVLLVMMSRRGFARSGTTDRIAAGECADWRRKDATCLAPLVRGQGAQTQNRKWTAPCQSMHWFVCLGLRHEAFAVAGRSRHNGVSSLLAPLGVVVSSAARTLVAVPRKRARRHYSVDARVTTDSAPEHVISPP